MHSAPSVSYPVGRSSFLAGLLGVLWLAGAMVCWPVWHEQGVTDWRAAVSIGATLLAGACAFWWWCRLPSGRLLWDGGQWSLQVTGVPAVVPATGTVRVALDLQSRLLLQLEGLATDGARAWLWLDASADPLRWHALRCAVYSRAMTDTQPDAGAVAP